MNKYKQIVTKIVNKRVLLVSLNLPKKFNALNADMGNEFQSVFNNIDYNEIGCVVVTGEGKNFSAVNLFFCKN